VVATGGCGPNAIFVNQREQFMKTGIIGLPKVGKTSLFRMLTKVAVDERRHANPRELHLGVARVPDERLDRLAALYHPRKLIHASVEYVDVAAVGQEALRETAYLSTLRTVDALIHVLRTFEDAAVPAVDRIDPLRDVRSVEFDLMLSDLGQIEKRLERLEKDLKRMHAPELEKEYALLQRCKAQLENEHPLRELELTAADEKHLRSFMFLSQKPVLYVLNIAETTALGHDLVQAPEAYKLTEVASRPKAGVAVVCAKVEAELAEMSDDEATDFLTSYEIEESGLVRLIRKSYELLGLISFFTVGDDECRAWTIPRGARAVEAAGAIHTDLEKHFIRAEVIRWDALLEAGSEAKARAKGTLRLEGKDYLVQDGDVVHIRHSG
jgi:GTP-binding protein YchF